MAGGYVLRDPESNRIIGVAEHPFADAPVEYLENAQIELAPADLRSAAMIDVMAAVSASRLRRVPNIAFQDKVYDLLAQEADAYVAAGRPEIADDLVLLTSAANGEQRTLSEEADYVRAKRDEYVAVLALTEAWRRAAAAAIGALEDPAEIEQARDFYVERIAAL